MASRAPGEIPHYVLDIFDDKPIAYLTTMRPDGRMSTNPVAALLRDGCVLVSTTKDRKKVRNLRADPRVTVCVVHRNNPNRYIEVRGTAELVDDTDPDELQRVVATHALSAHHLARLVLPSMRTRPRGDIVMISSAATIRISANGAPYNMGKVALEALARGLAKEEVRNGIHVNIVAPGLVDTEMGRRLIKATAGVDDIRKLDAMSPFGRVCAPEDVADVVRFFVSEAAGYVTGQIVYVDGGSGA